MGKSLSLDIRERVVALVEERLSCHEAARRLRISAASAVRIIQRKKRTGGMASSNKIISAAQFFHCGRTDRNFPNCARGSFTVKAVYGRQ